MNTGQIISITGSLFPFIFVGCWNSKGGKNNGAEREARVFQNIREESDIKYLFLGGDNIYPDKKETINASGIKHKVKHYPISRLYNGIQLLPDVPIYVALGNHNVYNSSIETAQKHLQMPNGYNNKDWHLPSNYYCLDFTNENIAIFFLNSNYYSHKSPANTNIDRQLEHNRIIMESWLEINASDCIKKGKHYFIIMHEPLFSVKKGAAALPNQENLSKIINNYPPSIIFSADTHNYEAISFKTISGHNITQMVVGTGGAILDPVNKDSLIKSTPYFTNITFKDTPLSAHGYLKVDKDAHKIDQIIMQFKGIT
jgi:hypothetical protein